jgi:light-regulated signal transduction histidine kinase (bacteriophytochrome)
MDDNHLMFAFAHDARTLLRTVLTRIQLVQARGGVQLPAEDQLMLVEAVTAVSGINGLLNSIVAYADVSSDDEVMNLDLLLQGVVIERKGALTEAGADVKVVNQLNLDVPIGVRNILKELVINCCKFRDKSRPLSILIATRSEADDTIEIAVTDNGLGVAPEYLEKIFTPFYRIHSRDEFPGYGLGLATCRRTAAVWAGMVIAEPGSDSGLTVRVTVPNNPSS